MHERLMSIVMCGCTKRSILYFSKLCCLSPGMAVRGGGRGTPYNGLYREVPPGRGTFFRIQAYKRNMRTLQVEIYERVGKSVI